MQGSCQCGGIRFEVAGPFRSLAFCHCTTCKKISGGVGTANGRARTDEITVLEGRELIETYQPQEGGAKSFCRVCGSNLFGGGWPNSEEASVRLSTIDSGLEQRPQVHNFVRSVAAWETLPDDGLPRYERYAPEPWDSVRPLYDAGRYAEAADKGRELIDARPDQASYLYYNVACCESLAGRTADAIEHLRQSIDMWERCRDMAREDSDFHPIRDEPAFAELIGR
jgi:hypothetical protein